jgi:predicted RNA binding protein YcfA (HicA-like mRNA interferase family)
MKSWSSREVLTRLLGDGWFVKHQVGSHVQLVHPTKAGKVTVPHPKKDVTIATVRSIFRQAEIPLED